MKLEDLEEKTSDEVLALWDSSSAMYEDRLAKLYAVQQDAIKTSHDGISGLAGLIQHWRDPKKREIVDMVCACFCGWDVFSLLVRALADEDSGAE